MVTSFPSSTAVMESQATAVQSLDGVLKRVNYRTREVTLVADSAMWHFIATPDSEYWFNGQRAMLRCFHPLDRVQVGFISTRNGHVLKALHGSDDN